MTFTPGERNQTAPEEKPRLWHSLQWNLEPNSDWNRDLIEHSHDLLCVHDLEGRLLSVNPIPARVLGYSVEELLRIPMRELVPPEFRPQFEEYLKTIARDGDAHGALALMTRSGEQRIWEYYSTLRTEGAAPLVHSMAHDVTERVLAERSLGETTRKLAEAAREQEAALHGLTLFRTLLDQSNDAIYVMEPQTLSFLDVNERACIELGYSRQELLSMTVYDIDPGYDEISHARFLQQTQESRSGMLEREHRRKNGTTFPAEVNVSRVWLDREYSVAVVRDITARKQAEAALRESAARERARAQELETVLEAVPFPVLIAHDAECRRITTNRAGYEQMRLPAGKNFSKSGPPEDQPPFRLLQDGVEIPTDSLPMQQTAATGQAVYGRTITTVFEDGNEREMLMNVVPLWDEEGKSRGAVGASIDLTELKKAEKALRESELRFRQAARVSHIGIFDHDHRTDTIYWSPEQREIFGFGPNEVVTLPVYLDHVYAQDREAMAAVRRAHDPAGNGLFDVEHRIVRRDGSLRWLSIRSQTFFEGEGDAHHRVRTVGAVLDITERKLMEEERQKLVEVAQNSPDFIGIATFDAKVLFVNEAGQALVGFERDRQITTTTIFDYLPTDEISRFGREVLPVVYSGKLWWGEVLLKHFRTGELIPVEMRAFPICDANGEVIAIANVSRDIRERKRAEGEILARTQQQRAIAELGLFALACKDLSPVFEKAVAAVAKTLGVEFCKVLQLLPDGKELLLRTGVGWHEGLVGRAKVKTDTASQAGYTLLCSEPVIAEDGRTETRFALPPLLLEHGVVSGISVVIPGHVKPFGVLGAHTQQRRTFTSDDANFLQSVANVLAQQIERNQSEQDLRQAEEKYRGIFDNAVLGIFQSTPDGRYLSVNQAMARMHGYTSPEEMVATVTDIEHQEYVDPSRRREFMRLLEEQGTVRDFEFEIYRKDGSRGWASLNVRAVLGEQGKLIYYEGTQEDITERKRIEEALRESEERLRLAQEAAKIGTFEHDFQTNENRWTPEMEAIYGVPPGGFPRSVEGFLDLVHEEDRPYVGRLVEQSMRDGDAEGEWRVIWPDGTVHWIAGRWRVFKDEEGRPVRALGMDFDVTERKRAEEALRRSEERYRSLVEATTQVVWTTGAAAEAVDIPIWCEFTGQSPEEARGDGWLESVHPDDREATKVAWSEALKNGNVYEREHRVRRRDGEYRFLSVRAVPVREKDGRIREWIGTCTDITERRRIEEDLRAGQEWIAQAQNAAHLGCFNWEIKNNRMAWSPEQEKIYGLAPGTFAGRYEDWRAMVLPEDREKAEASIEAQMGGGEASAEFRVLHQNTGQIRWVGAKGRVFTDRDGKPSRMIGINMDITERKQVEEALREAKERLTEEKLYLEQAIDTELGFEDIVGQSKALKSVMESVGRVASTGATVLLLGETGTGKELVARAIHRLSQRSANAFIKMNCAAIPSGLLESELFGAEKGAFTGAVSKKVGRLELADNGTLFLDEIGEISLALQPKLLRVLQDQEFERLGGTKTLKVDFRLIAATNRDLAEEVRENEFRSDLYYRLNVFPIRLPSLRERRDDIPMLVEYFVKKCARRMNKAIVSIPKKTMEALTAWDWPGNVRELENFIERSVILTNSSVLAAPLSELQRVSVERAKDETLAASERQLILNALRESRGKISGERGAAARLGLKRTTLQSKLKNLGIDPRRPPA